MPSLLGSSSHFTRKACICSAFPILSCYDIQNNDRFHGFSNTGCCPQRLGVVWPLCRSSACKVTVSYPLYAKGVSPHPDSCEEHRDSSFLSLSVYTSFVSHLFLVSSRQDSGALQIPNPHPFLQKCGDSAEYLATSPSCHFLLRQRLKPHQKEPPLKFGWN